MQLRDEANLAPDQSNEAERAEEVRRANLPDPDDYEEKLAAMSACEALELSLTEIHEASCALYIRHKYNQAVVDNFLGDEYVGAERKQPLKERMATSGMEVEKLTAQAHKVVGKVRGPFAKKSRRGRKRGS